MQIGVVEIEGFIDGGAFVAELDRSARIGGDVADADHPMRQMRAAGRRRNPRSIVWTDQVLSIGDREQSRVTFERVAEESDMVRAKVDNME